MGKIKEIASNPFTPKSGWEPRVFIGREKEIEKFKGILKKERNDHFLVLGEWGIGKTSLLKEFKKISQQQGVLTSLISISEFEKNASSLDAVKHLVHMIAQESPLGINKFTKFTKQLKSLGVQILGSGLSLSWQKLDTDPQSLLQNMLLTLWEDIKNKTEKFVVLLDDIQNFKNTSSILTILKNVLSNDKIQNTGFLFGLSSTPEGWFNFMRLHHPIGRYFVPRIELKRLNEKYAKNCIKSILKDTGIIFDKAIVNNIYKYTQGHPYELQVLCSNLYDNQINEKVSQETWESSLSNTLEELGKLVWDVMYEEASEQERKILYLLSLSSKPLDRKQIVSLIKKHKLNISENSVGGLLSRLLNKKLIMKPQKFKYHYLDNLFKEFILKIKGLDGEGTLL